ARIQRGDLDRRVVDFGQRRQRQEAIGQDADQQDRRHQQRGRDRAQDEQARRIHGSTAVAVAGSGLLAAVAGTGVAFFLPVLVRGGVLGVGRRRGRTLARLRGGVLAALTAAAAMLAVARLAALSALRVFALAALRRRLARQLHLAAFAQAVGAFGD